MKSVVPVLTIFIALTANAGPVADHPDRPERADPPKAAPAPPAAAKEKKPMKCFVDDVIRGTDFGKDGPDIGKIGSVNNPRVFCFPADGPPQETPREPVHRERVWY